MPDYALYRKIGGALSKDEFRRFVYTAWAYLEALTLGRVNRYF